MRKVYVLGAGASIGLNHGAPSMDGLLQKALAFSADSRDETISKTKAQEIKDFISEFYHHEMADVLPPFEDVLSQIDYCIVNNTPLSQIYTVEKLRNLRKALIYIMGRVIQVKTHHQTNEPIVGKFMNQLNQGLDSIISLN